MLVYFKIQIVSIILELAPSSWLSNDSLESDVYNHRNDGSIEWAWSALNTLYLFVYILMFFKFINMMH